MLDDSEHGYSYEMQATKAGRRAVEEKFAKINGKGAFHAGKCVFSVYIHMCVLICVFSSLAHTHTNPLLQRPPLPPQRRLLHAPDGCRGRVDMEPEVVLGGERVSLLLRFGCRDDRMPSTCELDGGSLAEA